MRFFTVHLCVSKKKTILHRLCIKRLSDQKCGEILDTYAVEDMHEGNWNQAAMNTWKAVAREVYAEYGQRVPEILNEKSMVSAKAEHRTFADADLSTSMTQRSIGQIIWNVIKSFVEFWLAFMFPFGIVYMYLIGDIGKRYKPSRPLHATNSTISDWNTSNSDCGGFGGGDSGGGGSFGGGGSSR